MAQIHYVIGDATEPINLQSEKPEYKQIIHIVNNVGVFGAGFVLALKKKWPITEKMYFDWKKVFGQYRLGDRINCLVEPQISVQHLIAQDGLPSKDKRVVVDYQALRKSLDNLGEDVLLLQEEFAKCNTVVHGPRLGCGIAGGEWPEVEKILTQTLIDRGIDVVIYDLPNKNQTS